LALDEGIDDEILPPSVADRLAFHVDLNDIRMAETGPISLQQCLISDVQTPGDIPNSLTEIAAKFGITSARAILFALRAARAHAVLHGRDTVDENDVTAAAGLVLAPRVLAVPEHAPQDDLPPPPDNELDSSDAEDPNGGQDDLNIPAEILLDAVKAALPADLLGHLATRNKKLATGGGSGTGDRQKGNRRGRPLAPRQGRFDGRSRLDLVATLRAAAPWQTIRKSSAKIARPIHIRSSDLKFKRFEDRSDRLLIFTVDASGSAAIARLAEAKGAVELLLAEAYARRDHVSLVAFRGDGAELLLPPTRSLVQTKRRLAAMVGGGGTPLAAGMKTAIDVARSAKGKGLTPTVALLTDGRANIALDGTANRAQAAQDAQRMARQAQSESIQGLVIDVSKRPEKALQSLADHLSAPYIPLPRADAKRLSQAVSASLDAL
ncbi:MAG: VWA domain-containing protein, partial [Pseudomonadota bacterium]